MVLSLLSVFRRMANVIIFFCSVKVKSTGKDAMCAWCKYWTAVKQCGGMRNWESWVHLACMCHWCVKLALGEWGPDRGDCMHLNSSREGGWGGLSAVTEQERGEKMGFFAVFFPSQWEFSPEECRHLLWGGEGKKSLSKCKPSSKNFSNQ